MIDERIKKAAERIRDYLNHQHHNPPFCFEIGPNEMTALIAILTEEMGEKVCKCSPFDKDFGKRTRTLTHIQTCDTCGGRIIEKEG